MTLKLYSDIIPLDFQIEAPDGLNDTKQKKGLKMKYFISRITGNPVEIIGCSDLSIRYVNLTNGIERQVLKESFHTSFYAANIIEILDIENLIKNAVASK